MSRFLMVDIGAGTMDVLWYDTQTDLHYKAVVKSPVRYLAEKAADLPGNLVITGSEMGGGPITQILKQRAKEAEVVRIGRRDASPQSGNGSFLGNRHR